MDEPMTREMLQKIALKFMETYKYLLLLWATRVGKTPAAIKIVKTYKGKWNIVVAETVHIQQWKNEFIKFDAAELLDNINIFCYHSLHKYKIKDTNWIFDEAHHLLSDKRWEMVSDIGKFNKVVFLTATLTMYEILKLRTKFFNLAVHTFSLADAIKNKILPEPKIYKVGLTMLDNKAYRNHTLSIGPKNTRKKHDLELTRYCTAYSWKEEYNNHPNYELIVRCTEKEKYDILDEIYENKKALADKFNNKYFKLNYLRAGLERKKFLAEIKTTTVRLLTKILKDRNVLIYTNSIDQAVELGGKNVMHSKQKNSDNEEVLNNFYANKFKHLYVVGMLVEGINLYHVDCGIIVQLDNKPRKFTQKSGRILLSDLPSQYILYIKDTRDEIYLENSLKGLDSKYIFDLDADKDLTNLY